MPYAYGGGDDGDSGGLDDLPLWVEMKKQVKILREEMETESFADQIAEFRLQDERDERNYPDQKLYLEHGGRCRA